MGLKEQLDKVVNGAIDIFSAPVGLVVDTARAIGSEEYNPGFGGVFGTFGERAVGGLSQIGEGFGADVIGEKVSDSFVGDALRSYFNTAERIYSTEFQRETGQGLFGQDPGELSLQRVGAYATGLSGSLVGAAGSALGLNEGGGLDQVNPVRQWQKAANRTPGQAWVEEALVPDFYNRSVSEQDEIRQTAWYNMFSGSMDAVGRWFTDPEVLAGKAFRYTRNRLWTFTPDLDNPRLVQRPKFHRKALKDLGYGMGETVEGPNGLRMVTLESGSKTEVYTVVRSSGLSQLVDDGVKFADDAVDTRPLAIPDDEIEHIRQVAIDNGVPEEGLDEFMDSLTRSGKVDDLNESLATTGMLGGKAKPRGRTPRYVGTTFRPLHLIADEDEAMRYASSLYGSDPTDMPVIVKLDPDGLPTIYEEFDMIPLTGPKDFDARDARFMTLADQASDNISDVRHLSPDDLDPALKLDGAPSYMQETGRLDSMLYNPDGTPVEPDLVGNIENLTEVMGRASQLYAEDPVMAQKYLLSNRNARASQALVGDSLAARASNHKVFQSHLNWLDNNGKGRSMSDIRRVLFPHTPFGDVVALWLSDATTYSQRRTVLLSAMGYRTSEVANLPPLLRAKLENLLLDSERVAAGLPPNEITNAILGIDPKLADTAAPYMDDFIKEATTQLQDQEAAARFLDQIADMAPIQRLRMPQVRRGLNVIRKTSFYQQSDLARPIRAVTEMRPHQWINFDDPMSSLQIQRQLEEAQTLGISRAEVDDFVKRYTESGASQPQRRAVVEEMNDFILNKAAAEAKLTPKEFEDLIHKSSAGMGTTRKYLESRRYASGGRDMASFFDDETGEIVQRAMPFLSTQATNWVPLPNARNIVKEARKIGTLRARFGANATIPVELLDSFYRIWKPTVLLRGGWMIRVVSDEQLRVLAKTGSVLNHLAAISLGEQPKFTKVFEGNLPPGGRTAAALATATGTQPITSLSVRGARVTTKVARKLGLVDENVYRHMQAAGLEDLVSARTSFGGPKEQTLRDLQSLIGRDEGIILNHLRGSGGKGTGQWRSITQGDPQFSAAWSRVLSEQYGRDPLARRLIQEVLAEGLTDLDALDFADMDHLVRTGTRFLKETAEGRAVAEKVPWFAKDPRKWVEDIVEEINGYSGGFNEELLRGSLNQKVTTELLESIDEAFRPDIIHSEIVDQTLGNSAVSQYLRGFTNEAFDLIGRLPTDTLSRQPFFKALYGQEMTRLERLRASQGLPLTGDAMSRMQTQARQFAIQEVQEYLYNLAETSRFGYMVRHIMPFYPAWQEVIQVWGKIALEDPSVIGRARLLWEAPNRANMVYKDDEGEEFIRFQLGEKAVENLGLTGWEAYLAQAPLDFAKTSFNLILNNPLPGTGPIIQYPVNEVVKRKPELEEGLRWLLPYGVTSDPSAIFLSPLVRQLKGELQGPTSDLSYRRAWQDAVTYMDVEFRAGRRTTPPTEEEAHEIAQKLRLVRAFTRMVMPAQPIIRSPLSEYIEAYRGLQDTLGPDQADEVFLNEYGNEFFAVTLSRTVSKTGIPPTVEGEMARRNFQNLIDEYPEYGRLIIGDEAIGEFSTAAFASQLERPVDPNNPFSEMERTYRPTEIDPRTGGIIEVDRRLGWQEYIQALDWLDLERRKRGLPNLKVKEAQDLADTKEFIKETLKFKYPSWWEDFNTRDALKWSTRIDAFRTIAKDTSLENRPDIQGLATYLEVRGLILQELNRRKMDGGASTLDATSNLDLQNIWATLVTQMLDDNIAFGPLYYRYLEGDPLELRSG